MTVLLPFRRYLLGAAWCRNLLWKKARAVPSLDLDFAGQKNLTDGISSRDLITFTRASSGTYVGSDGLLKTAVTNLVLRSEEFNDAAWTKTSATVTANAATAPNGTLTADKLITDSGATGGRVSVSITLVVGSPTTLSCYAKQGETSVFGLFVSDGVTGRSVDFDLITGTVSVAPTAGMTASIDPVGNGWYRCVATVASPSGTSGSIRIRQVVTANNGTDGIFIWGAQLEQASTAGDYVPTTSTINSAPRFDHNPTTGESLGLLVEEARTNLWLQSQFASSWTPTRATLQVNDIVAPDATMTGAKLIEDTTASLTHLITQSISVTSGTPYTVSVFVKATASPRFLQFIFPSSSFTNTRRPVFDLVNGTALAATDTTASIQNFGNGWYRCIASMSATVTGSAALQLQLADTYTNAASNYTGNGVSGVYIWGAQVEALAFPTSYIPTTTATVTRAADVASITGSNFSFYNQTEGTVFSDCVGTFSSTQVLVNIAATAANTATSAISLASNLTSSQKRVRVRDAASADQASLGLGGSSSGSRTRIAAAIKANDFAASLDGGAALTDTTGTVPTVVLMEIGSAPSGVTLGTQLHRRLTYWPVRLPNTSLQAITQP